MGRGPLLVVGLVALVGVGLWASGSTRRGAEPSLERSSSVADANEPAQGLLADVSERAPEVQPRREVAARSKEAPRVEERRADAPGPPARFEVVVLDHRRVPLEGVRAVGVVRAWRPGAEGRAPAGRWGGRSANNGGVVARVSGPELTSDANGRIAIEIAREDRANEVPAGRELEAELTVYPPDDASYAHVDGVRVDEGDVVTVVLGRPGSLEVTLASLPGGVVPHVDSFPRDRHHTDVVLRLEAPDGSKENASPTDAVDTTRWEGLGPGRYRLVATTHGRIDRAPLATLEDLVVESGLPCDDPRLVRWDPFAGHDPMLVEVVRADGSTPDSLVVGYVFGAGPTSSSQTAGYDGRRMPIVGTGRADQRVFFETAEDGRVSLPIEPGSRRVVLGDAIRLHLRLVAPPREPGETLELLLQRNLRAGGGSSGSARVIETLGPDDSDVRFDLPVPGAYDLYPVVRTATGGVRRFETVRVDVPRAADLERTVHLEPRH